MFVIGRVDGDTSGSGSANRRVVPCVLLVAVVCTAGMRGAVAQVVINEIMYNPETSSESNREFVELYNAGSSSVDLSGYKFREGDGTTWKESAAFGPISLGATDYLIITNAPDEATFRGFYSDVPAGTPFVFFEMTLVNNPDGTNTQQVELLDASSQRVDWVLYDDTGDWVDVADGYSLELTVPDATKNDSGTYWKESLVANGTPGRVNSVTPEPGSFLLFGLGLGWLAGRRRRRYGAQTALHAR